MTGHQTPILRRYWFADIDAVDAIDAAVNPPQWGASPVPVTIICQDAATFAALAPISGSDDAIEVIDASGEAAFFDVFGAHLAKEHADYVQITSHAIEDFPASIFLMIEQLAEEKPQALASTLLAVSRYQTDILAADTPVPARTTWMATSHIRSLLSEVSGLSPATLIEAIETKIAKLNIVPVPLVTGAFYLNSEEQAELSNTEDEAALWRARAAVSEAEIDRLQSEKRVRAGREAALRARHDRDLAQQAERSRAEIERLHRAVGWVGRWRARFARMFGRK